MEGNRRPKALVILEQLLAGFPVKFPDDVHTYYYQDGVFGIEATHTNTSEPGFSEQVLLGVDITIPQFIQMCEKLSWDEIFVKGCELVLRKYNSRRRR